MYNVKTVNTLEDFIVNLFSLEEKTYNYVYKIDGKFFEAFEGSPISKGTFDINVHLEKRISMLMIDFEIKGIVSLECHKSLAPFEEPLVVNQQLAFKLGDHFEELSDELYMIPENMTELDLSTYVYELIAVQLPIRIIHPDLREEDEQDEEEKMVYSTHGAVESEKEEIEPENEDIDPRWQALKSLNQNNLN